MKGAYWSARRFYCEWEVSVLDHTRNENSHAVYLGYESGFLCNILPPTQ